MTGTNRTTLRLLMPQWQGGNNGDLYPFGARLLAWLAPEGDSPIVEVPVDPYDGTPPPIEGGIVGKTALLRQLESARKLIEARRPDRIIVYGGDCLVDQAPFAYLNERYDGRLGVLWIDAHPDVTTPKEFQHEHAMVLGNLLGEGDPDFATHVPRPLDPKRVMFAGLEETSAQENDVISRLGLRRARTSELINNSEPVLQWLREESITHLAIHLDLDVLDPVRFRSLLFANPDAEEPINAPSGTMTMGQLTRLLKDVERHTDVVGIGIAEHMPWDAFNLKTMLDQLSFMR